MADTDKMELLYKEARDEAARVIEKRARAIMRKHRNLHEFVMGMGCWYFRDKDGNTISDEDRAYLKPIDDFVCEWDEVLRVTETQIDCGNGAKFRRSDGRKVGAGTWDDYTQLQRITPEISDKLFRQRLEARVRKAMDDISIKDASNNQLLAFFEAMLKMPSKEKKG